MTMPPTPLVHEAPAHLEWDCEIPVATGGDANGRSAGTVAGIVLGLIIISVLVVAAVFANLADGDEAAYRRGFVITVVAVVAISIGTGLIAWIVRQQRMPRINRKRYPIQFRVHDLGAEATGDAPGVPADLLLAQLRSRAGARAKHGFWDSLTESMIGILKTDPERPDADAGPEIQRRVDWNEVTAVAVDPYGHTIDLGAEGSPGLRLHCTPENFPEVRRFVRKRVPLRFWDELRGSPSDE